MGPFIPGETTPRPANVKKQMLSTEYGCALQQHRRSLPHLSSSKSQLKVLLQISHKNHRYEGARKGGVGKIGGPALLRQGTSRRSGNHSSYPAQRQNFRNQTESGSSVRRVPRS